MFTQAPEEESSVILVIANLHGYPIKFSEYGEDFFSKVFVNKLRYISHSLV